MNSNSKLKSSCIIIVIALLILIFNVNASAQNFTIIYRDYLGNMIDIVDREVPPCVNFFQHACGNFENQQKDESTSDVEPFLYNKQDYYRFFIDHKQNFSTIPGFMVRNVYNLCKEALKKTNGQRPIWLRMINVIPFLQHDHDLLRKWPFLQYQWKKYAVQLDLSWQGLAAEFTAHGLNTFLNVFFTENTIYLAPNDELQCLELNEFKASLVPLLGKRHEQIADIIGKELWQFCRYLNREEALSGEKVEVENLLVDETMREFFLRLFLRLNLSDLEIEKAGKVTIHKDKLTETLTLLRSTNPRIIYNFILWQAYQQLANIDDCFQLSHEFDSLLQVEYWHWYAFKGNFSRDVVMASYLFHTTRFQRHYRQFIISTSWERLFQKRAERKDLNIERSIKNYAKQYLDLERYTSTFKTEFFLTEKPTFYSYLLELRKLKMRHTFLTPYEDLQESQFFKEFLNFSILLLYRPRLHYFASYDREMWQKSKLLQSSDGFYSALDCLNHQTSLYAEDSKIYGNLSIDEINDIFNFYTAFIEALSDYRFWLESENFAIAEDFILKYFKLDSKRVMFYAVAQQFCKRNDFIFSVLINRSYMNMPEFQEAFECMSTDEMSPITKCMVNQCLSK